MLKLILNEKLIIEIDIRIIIWNTMIIFHEYEKDLHLLSAIYLSAISSNLLIPILPKFLISFNVRRGKMKSSIISMGRSFIDTIIQFTQQTTTSQQSKHILSTFIHFISTNTFVRIVEIETTMSSMI